MLKRSDCAAPCALPTRAVPGNSLDVFTMVVNLQNGQRHDVTNDQAFDDEADWGPQGQGALTPEAPLAILLPTSALGIIGLGTVLRRRRHRATA